MTGDHGQGWGKSGVCFKMESSGLLPPGCGARLQSPYGSPSIHFIHGPSGSPLYVCVCVCVCGD